MNKYQSKNQINTHTHIHTHIHTHTRTHTHTHTHTHARAQALARNSSHVTISHNAVDLEKKSKKIQFISAASVPFSLQSSS